VTSVDRFRYDSFAVDVIAIERIEMKVITCTANRGKVYDVSFVRLADGNFIPVKVEVHLAYGLKRRIWIKDDPEPIMGLTAACAVRAAQRKL
jgi:hypothetical protein